MLQPKFNIKPRKPISSTGRSVSAHGRHFLFPDDSFGRLDDSFLHLDASFLHLDASFWHPDNRVCLLDSYFVGMLYYLIIKLGDLDFVRKVMGHASIKTTQIYLHVLKTDLTRTKSPLDNLDL